MNYSQLLKKWKKIVSCKNGKSSAVCLFCLVILPVTGQCDYLRLPGKVSCIAAKPHLTRRETTCNPPDVLYAETQINMPAVAGKLTCNQRHRK